MIDLSEELKFDNIELEKIPERSLDKNLSHQIKKVTFVYKNRECKELVLKAYKFEGWEKPFCIKRDQKIRSEQMGEVFIVDLIDCDEVLEKAKLLNNKISNDKILVVIGKEDRINTLNALKSIGVHYLLWPLEQDDITQCIRSISKSGGIGFEENLSRRAKRISVIGTRGGCGTSVVTLEIASALAKEGSRSILVDHHYLHGNIDILLSRKDLIKVDIASITVDIELLDEDSTENYLSEINKDFLYLALDGVASQSTLEKYTESVVDKLRRKANFIIDDYSPSIDFPLDIGNIVSLSNIIVMVIEPSVTSIRNTQNLLDKVNEASLTLTERPRIIIIVNRHRPAPSFSFSCKEVERFISRKVDVEIPFYKKATSHLLDGGKLIDLGRRSSNPFYKVRQLIIGEELKQRKSLIKNWFSRSRR